MYVNEFANRREIEIIIEYVFKRAFCFAIVKYFIDAFSIYAFYDSNNDDI